MVHGMRPGDEERRLTFLANMDLLIDEDPDFLSLLLWKDESTFTNNGMFNCWNFRTWADANPRMSYATRHQVRYSVNVWCGLVGDQLIGPYFFTEGPLNGERYLLFLQETLPSLLEDVPLHTRLRLWFQHDGCPAHNARAVSRFLDRQFATRWIGNQSLIPWPARSPDLTPMDFYLWGYVKNIVYAANLPPIASNEELRERIRDACRSISPDSIRAAVADTWVARAQACLQADGGHFEHLM